MQHGAGVHLRGVALLVPRRQHRVAGRGRCQGVDPRRAAARRRVGPLGRGARGLLGGAQRHDPGGVLEVDPGHGPQVVTLGFGSVKKAETAGFDIPRAPQVTQQRHRRRRVCLIGYRFGCCVAGRVTLRGLPGGGGAEVGPVPAEHGDPLLPRPSRCGDEVGGVGVPAAGHPDVGGRRRWCARRTPGARWWRCRLGRRARWSRRPGQGARRRSRRGASRLRVRR